MMIMTDPPRHDKLRSLVSRAFTPRAVSALEPRVAQIARELADEIWGHGGDLVPDYTEGLPTLVIAEMLGVDPADGRFFKEKSNELVRQKPLERAAREVVAAAATALYEYLEGTVADRRNHPRDDLISALIAAEIDGVKLTNDELVGFCFLLLVAGNETTTNLLGNALVLLHPYPEHRARLEDQPSTLPSVIEEVLRFDSPVQGLARTTTREVEVAQMTIPPGEQVPLLFGSANRDEREFTDANRFDPDRRPERHLAFGHGVHHCLGAALARLGTRVALAELLERRHRYALIGDEVEWISSGPVRGPRSLPTTITGS